MRTFTTMTTLGVAPDQVWQRVITPEGINAELRPVLRMTVPRAWRGTTLETVAPGTRLGRSWLLLFGVLPVDYDNITLVEWEPGRRFREDSTTLSMRHWQHERSVLPWERGCIVQDQVSFAVRNPLALLPGLERLCGALLQALFRHRHRRLLTYFAQHP
jgi:ligand-binding SRPBCC domain-containing protein